MSSFNDSDDEIDKFLNELDAEYSPVKCITFDEVEKFLNELVEELSTVILVTSSVSKILLYKNKWDIHEIVFQYTEDANKLLVKSKILQANFAEVKNDQFVCTVCFEPVTEKSRITNLGCGHCFCDNCWRYYFEIKIKNNVSTEISCMALKCDSLVPEDIVLSMVNKQILKKQYQDLAIREYIKSYPLLCFCPGADCNAVILSEEFIAKKPKCSWCKCSFCYKCGNEYHAPADCDTLKKWLAAILVKSNDLTNLKLNIKTCPNCNVYIQKNGGCNDMFCKECGFAFSWMCNKYFKTSARCSGYKGSIVYDPHTVIEKEPAKNFPFYYGHYKNHSKSLESEKQTLDTIKNRINNELVTGEKRFLDWQYLLRAADLIMQCTYTLKYTYPHAYYMEDGPKKELFEYQQARLENEIKNLYETIEKASNVDITSKHMQIAKKLNMNLLDSYFG